MSDLCIRASVGIQEIDMIKSMTGFGRSEHVTDAYKIVVEMKSVNHRFCDINIKLPKKISFFETTIRTYLKKYIERARSMCSLRMRILPVTM